MTSSVAVVMIVSVGFMLFLLGRRVDTVLEVLLQNTATDRELRLEDALQKAIENCNNAKAKIEKKSGSFLKSNFGISP